ENSIYNLWRTFNTHPNVAGICGEIVAMTSWSKLLNPIVGAQYFEYKMSNILDKPLESVFGYITVLPGAFSAYRYIALQNNIVDGKPEGPLVSYFMGEKDDNDESKKDDNGEIKNEEIINNKKSTNTNNIFTANMYLAEDRILTFELVTKRDSKWLLHYIKSSQAETDIPKSIDKLISQRRRWLNGSLFASLYAVSHFYYIWRRDSFSSPTDPTGIKSISEEINEKIFVIFIWVYVALICAQFIFAMGNKPKSSKYAYIISLMFFGLIMVYTLLAGLWLTIKGILDNDPNINSVLYDEHFRNIVLALLSTYGLYLIGSLLMFDALHMFTCIIQYTLLVPFYVNILNVYAFCNIHDVSWGNREADDDNELKQVTTHGNDSLQFTPIDTADGYEKAKNALGHRKENKVRNMNILTEEEYRKRFRIYFVLLWILTNAVLATIVLGINQYLPKTTTTINAYVPKTTTTINAYVIFILWSIAGLALFRFLGSLVYFLLELPKTLRSLISRRRAPRTSANNV
ncbi:17848_t:CDS:2, partial [Racocetra persica]